MVKVLFSIKKLVTVVLSLNTSFENKKSFLQPDKHPSDICPVGNMSKWVMFQGGLKWFIVFWFSVRSFKFCVINNHSQTVPEKVAAPTCFCSSPLSVRPLRITLSIQRGTKHPFPKQHCQGNFWREFHYIIPLRQYFWI